MGTPTEIARRKLEDRILVLEKLVVALLHSTRDVGAADMETFKDELEKVGAPGPRPEWAEAAARWILDRNTPPKVDISDGPKR